MPFQILDLVYHWFNQTGAKVTYCNLSRTILIDDNVMKIKCNLNKNLHYLTDDNVMKIKCNLNKNLHHLIDDNVIKIKQTDFFCHVLMDGWHTSQFSENGQVKIRKLTLTGPLKLHVHKVIQTESIIAWHAYKQQSLYCWCAICIMSG